MCWLGTPVRAPLGTRLGTQRDAPAIARGEPGPETGGEKMHFQMSKSLLFQGSSSRSCCWPSGSVPCCHLSVGVQELIHPEPHTAPAHAFPHCKQFSANSAPKAAVNTQSWRYQTSQDPTLLSLRGILHTKLSPAPRGMGQRHTR